jgi:lipopolysaccharide export system protein LptC
LTPSASVGAPSPPASALIRREARAHSRLVFVLRRLFPALIVALLGALAAVVIQTAMRDSVAAPKEAPTEIRMIAPHFIGRDDKGRAYNLAARLAVRDDADMQRVILGAPVLMLDADSAHPKTLTADRGLYDEDTRILKLSGHVRVDDATASTVATGDAYVDTRSGLVSGVSPISASGPGGSIRANSYSADQKSGRVVLHGGVRAELEGARR